MVSMKHLLIVLASTITLCVAAEAKTLTLIKGDHGILGAMRRGGCHNPNYFPEVLRHSRILESQLSNLPEGTLIVIPDECQSNAPAHEDIKVTRQIFSNQAALQSVREVSQTNITLTNNLSVANKTIADLSRQYQITVTRLNSQVAELRKDFEAAKKRNRTNLLFFTVLSLLVGGVVALGLCFLFPVRRLKRIRDAPQQKEGEAMLQSRAPASSIVFHGEVYPFADASEHWVACPIPGCRKRVRPDTASRLLHLIEHPHLRLKWIRPEKAKQLLGIED